MALAIEHKTLCNLVLAFFHEGNLYLVLDFLHRDAVVDVKVREDAREGPKVNGFLYRVECLYDGIHDFVKRKAFGNAISLCDC